MDRKKVIAKLNEMLEHEMAAIVTYLHHSFVVPGIHRQPVVDLMQLRAKESMAHATLLGNKIMALGGHPSVRVSEVFEPGPQQTTREMLEEELEAERKTLEEYKGLLRMVKDDVPLEFMVRGILLEEQGHVESLEIMLRGEGREE
ncbi:MAG: bacterioferritin [Planctomycetes bacterium]|nr:bacterioferritin [Planctomycetota bacterium]